jgi:hypothetical protein
MSSQQNHVEAFIAGLRGRAVMLELRQQLSRAGGILEYETVRQIEFNDGAIPAELAAQVLELAADDARTLGGKGFYVLVGLNDAGSIVERKAFHVEGMRKIGAARYGEDDAPADRTNDMLMRHLEARERTSCLRDAQMAKQQETLNNAYQRQIDGLMTRAERLENREIETMHVYEKLISSTHQRDLENKKQDAQFQLQERTLHKLEPAIPALLNKLLGMPLVPTDMQDPLDALFSSLTTEQLGTIQGALTQEQGIALGMMATESIKRRETKEAARRARLEEDARARDERAKANGKEEANA